MFMLLILRPFTDQLIFKFEIFNEIISILFCYMLFSFLLTEHGFSEGLGWISIGILCTYLLIHLSSQIIDSVLNLKKSCRKKYQDYKTAQVKKKAAALAVFDKLETKPHTKMVSLAVLRKRAKKREAKSEAKAKLHITQLQVIQEEAESFEAEEEEEKIQEYEGAHGKFIPLPQLCVPMKAVTTYKEDIEKREFNINANFMAIMNAKSERQAK